MTELGVSSKDFVLIKGKNEALAKVELSRVEDNSLNLIRMDSSLRSNSGTGLGEEVEIVKIEVKEAKSIEISPTEEVKFTGDPTKIFKEKLVGKAVVKGNLQFFNIMGTTLHYIVSKTSPKKYVRISTNTQLKVSEKVLSPKDLKVPSITYDDIGGLEEEISSIREMIEIPMKHPEVFEKIGISPLKEYSCTDHLELERPF